MARLTRLQWQSLIEEFENSGFSQATFCQQHNLNPKYFSLKRSRLISERAQQGSAFSTVRITDPQPGVGPFELVVGSVTIKLPPTTSHTFLAQLIRSLA